jgi:hypothetical protein
MPQRFLRPGLTTSSRWNAVSWKAQSFFVRLITIVDDFGRTDGRAAVLWANCFAVWNFEHPRKPDNVTLQQVAEMLQQLAAAELIDVYTDEETGKTVLQIEQWQERIREKVKEKWPAKKAVAKKLQQPSGEVAGSCRKNPPSSSSSSSSSSSDNQTPTPPAGDLGASERANDLVEDEAEAKRLICELILGGKKDPRRPWSYQAQSALSEQLPIPLREIKLIAWFHSLPKDEAVHELKVRRQSEGTLLPNWSDEVTRAAAYRKKIGAGRNGSSAKKDPPRWREFFQWKYANEGGGEFHLPERFDMLGADQKQEWELDHERFEREVAKK